MRSIPGSAPRTRLGIALALLALTILSGCSSEPVTTIQPGPTLEPVTVVASLAPSPAPTVEAMSTPTVVPVASLPPLQPLHTQAVVDRLAPIKSVTDGSRPYRFAQWAPGGPWIAATPQDGPGVDVINSETGDVLVVLTDTYVLEPEWDVLRSETDTPCLLLHTTANDRDQISTACAPGFEPRDPIVTVDGQVRAPVLSGDRVFFSADGEINVASAGVEPQVLGLGDALVIAPSPAAPDVLAWTPTVTNLEQVRVDVARIDTGERRSISKAGEGLWLPRWSPDGQKLALTSIGSRIAATTVDGSARYDLGPGDQPAWSPDNTRIAYAGVSAGDEFLSRDIHVVDWQGQAARVRLTDAGDGQFYTSPSWSPDGSQLAFVEIDSGQIFIAVAP